MILDIIKFYETGKKLGLTRKEISKIMLFDSSKHAWLWRTLLILFMILIIIGWFNSLVFLTRKINENVYPTGTMYSSVKLKDFKMKLQKK